MKIAVVDKQTSIQQPNKAAKTEQEIKLLKRKKACQDFEAILVGKLMKESMAGARKISKGSDAEDARPFGPLEDLTVEMVAEEICESGGVGLWKMLYDQVSQQNGVNGDSGDK